MWTDGWMEWTDAPTVGYFLGTYSVRKSSQESVSTQQIPVNFYRINLILKFRKFKVPNKGPFMSTDGRTDDAKTLLFRLLLEIKRANTEPP